MTRKSATDTFNVINLTIRHIHNCCIPSLRLVVLHGLLKLLSLRDAGVKLIHVHPCQISEVSHLDAEILCERLAGLASMVHDVLRLQIVAVIGPTVVYRRRPQLFEGARVAEYPEVVEVAVPVGDDAVQGEHPVHERDRRCLWCRNWHFHEWNIPE